MQYRTTRAARWLIAAALGIVLAFSGTVIAQPTTTAKAPAAAPVPQTGMAAALALEDALVEAIAKCEKSVVAIARVSREAAPFAMDADAIGMIRGEPPAQPGDYNFIPNEYAAGVIMDAEGTILTAYHVLGERSTYYVTTADRQTYEAEVKAADPRSDLAVLKLLKFSGKNLQPMKLGDASKLRKGQIVIALGNPYAIARDGQVSASWGIVANVARKDNVHQEARSAKPTLHQYGTLIQTDARLHQGTSGGALINLSGEMVGLTVALSNTMGHEQLAGYALPVDETFRRVFSQLKEGREAEYGFLGIAPRSPTLKERQEGRNGVVVSSVVAGTPAARLGLLRDDLVVKVGEEPVLDPDQFMLEIGRQPASEHVQLTWLRRSQQRPGESTTRLTGEVELAKYYVPGEKFLSNRPAPWRGVRVDFVTASPRFQDRANQGRIDPEGSVLVTEVQKDSPAWKEGLRAEMMISQVNARAVRSPSEFAAAVADKAGPVDLSIQLPSGEHWQRTILPGDE